MNTTDGWRLAVHHYRPPNEASGTPVILCHGLSANRYVFDLPAGPSLAQFLRDHGRDVWVAELRGSGMSARPGLSYRTCRIRGTLTITSQKICRQSWIPYLQPPGLRRFIG